MHNIERQNNHHYWLQQDILQITQFQYTFFQNIILYEDIVPQIKVYSQLLLKLFRFNYQHLWEEQDQPASKNFPQALTHTELLPFIIQDGSKHLLYKDLTQLHMPYFEIISYDHTFYVEHSETSDSRPYVSSEITIDNPYYVDESTTSQNEQIETCHDPQETFNDKHQNSDDFLEQTQQNQNTLTFDTTSTIQDESNTDTHTDTRSVSQLLRTPTF